MSRSVMITVSGRVQGVSYRAFVKKQAEKLGISGYAKNLSSGDVEILAYGDSESLEKLIQFCRTGPMLAKVSSLIRKEHALQHQLYGFDIL